MSIDYYAPTQMDELLTILAEKQANARVLAGGTDLVVEMRESDKVFGCLVSISKIAALRGITREGDTIFVGPLTTFTELAQSPIIAEGAFLLAQAALSAGSPQIRNQGTVGGNIVNASPAADTVPALVALEARLRLSSLNGEREMPLEEFLAGIGKTRLEPGEVLTGISFKALPQSTGSAFVKLGRRNALSISRVSVAVIVGYDPEGMTCTDCRIAVGSVAPNPFRTRSAEQIWLKCSLTRSNRDACVSAALREIAVTLGQRASAGYKKEVAPALIRRAIDAALGQVFSGWEKSL
jgi:CO/xanthine dehydrogenase FAD-binding subunit